MLDNDTTLADLRAPFPRRGRVAWIGLRPALRAAIRVVDSAQLTADAGIEGDHRAARGGGKRQVTFIQQAGTRGQIRVFTYISRNWDLTRIYGPGSQGMH